jgi:hypothetical protein
MAPASTAASVASAAVLAQLESRAVSAEKMILLLKRQIAQIKSELVKLNLPFLLAHQKNLFSGVALAPPAPSFDEECEALRRENAALKADIQHQKVALVAAEEANGIKQASICRQH